VFSLLNDVRYGIRQLRKAPVFTMVAVTALAVGVGANVTIFGFVSALLLKPLDIPNPDRVIRAYSSPTDVVAVIDYRDFEQYRDRNQSLESLAMFHWGGLRPVRVASGLNLDMIQVMPVTGNYFGAIGIQAAMGRTITPDDDKPGVPDVVMLSDTCWRRHFNADPNVIGRAILISKRPVTIVGVLPASFKGTIGAPVIPQFYVPWNGLGQDASSGGGFLIGRLRPGISRAAAQADLSRIAAQLTAEHKRTTTISVSSATTMAPMMISATSWFAVLFLVIAGVVLLIACDNLAILLSARAVARRREIGVRLALGASKSQLLRQFVTESLVLSTIGGAGALLVAFVTARSLTRIYLPVPMPIALTFDFDWRVVSFAVGVSLLTTLLFGLGPALQSIKSDVVSSLKDSAQGVGTSGAKGRTALVITQAALSTALLVTAAVMVKSLVVPQHAHKGFDSDGVLIATFNLPAGDYSRDRGIAFCDQLVERLQRMPAVIAASVMDNIPAANSRPLPYAEMQDSQSARASAESVYTFAVSPRHFDVLGIRLLEGRDFTEHDDSSSTAVGIANETLAGHFWPGENPIGHHLRTRSGLLIEVVGVAADSTYESLDEGTKPFLYRPFAQAYFPTPTLLVKTSGRAAPVLSAIRRDVTQLDPDLLAYTVMPLDDRLALSVLPNRAVAWAAGLLGLGALALGAIGTYGVMALLAQQRRREIGIRMALGARPSDAIRLVAGQGMTWTAVGVGLGMGLAIVSTALLRRLVFGISSTDPFPYLAVAAFIAATAFCACYVPARRASLVDPVVALRDE